jgi:hypothetical protein
MSFSFEFNYQDEHGRKISQEEWIRGLAEEATATAMPSLAKKVNAEVARLRCPVHGEHPKVVKSTIDGNRLTTEISACCDEMRDRAQKVAAGQ